MMEDKKDDGGYLVDGDSAAIELAFMKKPMLPGQGQRFDELNAMAGAFSIAICKLCPPSRERFTAVASVETAIMWATEAIRRNEIAAGKQ